MRASDEKHVYSLTTNLLVASTTMANYEDRTALLPVPLWPMMRHTYSLTVDLPVPRWPMTRTELLSPDTSVLCIKSANSLKKHTHPHTHREIK